MTYRFLSPAQQDVAGAMRHYEEAVPGLGLEFLEELERTVQRILHQPEAWKRLAEHQRRCRMRRFPYGVIYSIEHDALVIIAVFHLHRHPDSWKERT